MTSEAVPRGWVNAALSEIAEVRLGRQRSPDRATGPHMRPYLRAANVTWKGIDLADVKEMDFSPAECELYALRDGDILLSEASGSPHEVGKPAIWRQELPLCCFQNTLLRVRLSDPSLVRFMHLHFTKDALTGRFANASRGVGIHHLGAAALAQWQVALPSAAEQAAIVNAVDSYFSRLDDAITTLDRVQRDLKRHRASVLKAAVEGRLVPTEAELARAENRNYEPASQLLKRILVERRRRWEEAELAKMKATGKAPKDDGWESKYEEPEPPDTSHLPDLPEGWCWSTATQVCYRVVDCHNKTAPYVESGIPLLRTTNIRDGRLKLDKLRFVNEETYAFWSRRCPPQPNDVLFTREAPMGEAALVPDGMRVCMGQRMMLLRADPQFILPQYLVHAVQAPHVLRFASRHSVGTGVQHLRVGDVERMPVPLPPIKEQARIVEAVEKHLSVIEVLGAQAEASEHRCARLRQSILKWAFEGKLVDQDPNDEPASVLLERIRAERAATSEKNPTSRRRGRPASKST